MLSTIKCPKCGEPIELSAAVKNEWEEEFKKDQEKEIEKAVKEEREKTQEKVKADFNLKLKQTIEEINEEKIRSKKLLDELSEMNKLIRDLKRKDEERQLSFQKKITDIEDNAKNEARKKADEESRLKLLEKDKKLEEIQKINEELKRKISQGSQQTQGEVLELELEKILKTAFPNDEILPVEKGIRGADIIQKVWDSRGNFTGSIVWETKNAKWDKGWVQKLKNDQRTIKAEIAVLISVNLPPEVTSASYIEGIWVADRKFIIGLSSALRAGLIQIFHVKKSNIGKNTKMETIYNYISGVEFTHRIDTIVEAFGQLQNEMEKEKRFFANKWARQEKFLRGAIDHTLGIHGDFKGILGTSIPELKSSQLSLEPGDKDTE